MSQVQKIASESMIPTYRSGGDSPHKTSKQQQQQQPQQTNSFSANASKVENKNVVNNETNQNQCNSPVKRHSTSQIEVRNHLFLFSTF